MKNRPIFLAILFSLSSTSAFAEIEANPHSFLINPSSYSTTAKGSGGLTAQQLRTTYSDGLYGTGNQPEYRGQGVTVALIEGGSCAGVYEDLVQYAAESGLPAPSPNQILIGNGGGPLNGWGREARLDSQLVYALLPKATIRIFCAPSSKLTDLTDAILGAISMKADVISMSFGVNEGEVTHSKKPLINGMFPAVAEVTILDKIFADLYPQIIFVASAGDYGQPFCLNALNLFKLDRGG